MRPPATATRARRASPEPFGQRTRASFDSVPNEGMHQHYAPFRSFLVGRDCLWLDAPVAAFTAIWQCFASFTPYDIQSQHINIMIHMDKARLTMHVAPCREEFLGILSIGGWVDERSGYEDVGRRSQR